MYSDSKIAREIRKFWKKEGVCDVVVFFEQKYKDEDKWEEVEVLAECESDTDYNTITFNYDFCEGEEDVRDVKIIPFHDVLRVYRFIMKGAK